MKYPIAYDNGGKSFDRYTVIYNSTGDYIAMSEHPTHPQGFGQHGEGIKPGRHLGKRIPINALPIDCRLLVDREAYYSSNIFTHHY